MIIDLLFLFCFVALCFILARNGPAPVIPAEAWIGDCFYCDGNGCRYCGGGWQPWCQMIDPDDPDGETVCAKCLGGKMNSMGDDCPNCDHFPEGIKAPFHKRWLTDAD